jgi:hypothetical protein
MENGSCDSGVVREIDASGNPMKNVHETAAVMPAQSDAAPCPTCGPQASPPSYIYAIGRVECRCPSPSLAKELGQATSRAGTTGLTDQQALQKVLGDRQNRYLVRQQCWVFSVQGLETYILAPRDPADYDLLIQCIRWSPAATDLDVVIGVRGPMAPATACNGLVLPLVIFDQLYSFSRDELMKSVPRPDAEPAETFTPAVGEVFDRIMAQSDNAGASDAHRALNYLAMRYPAIYATAASAYAGNSSLSMVSVKPSPLSQARNVVEVIFSYTNRTTDVTQKYFTRVDVTEEFPFLVTKMAPYYDCLA